MFRQTSENRMRLLVLLCGLFVMAVALSPAVAGDDTESPASEPEATSSRAVTLPDLGLELDLYSVQSPAKYQDQYLELDKRVRAYLDGDHSKSEKKAARYLWAEVKLALGQYREAEDLFKKFRGSRYPEIHRIAQHQSWLFHLSENFELQSWMNITE